MPTLLDQRRDGFCPQEVVRKRRGSNSEDRNLALLHNTEYLSAMNPEPDKSIFICLTHFRTTLRKNMARCASGILGVRKNTGVISANEGFPK